MVLFFDSKNWYLISLWLFNNSTHCLCSSLWLRKPRILCENKASKLFSFNLQSVYSSDVKSHIAGLFSDYTVNFLVTKLSMFDKRNLKKLHMETQYKNCNIQERHAVGFQMWDAWPPTLFSIGIIARQTALQETSFCTIGIASWASLLCMRGLCFLCFETRNGADIP